MNGQTVVEDEGAQGGGERVTEDNVGGNVGRAKGRIERWGRGNVEGWKGGRVEKWKGGRVDGKGNEMEGKVKEKTKRENKIEGEGERKSMGRRMEG